MSAALGASYPLRKLTLDELETAASIGFEARRDTAEIKDLINTRMQVEPVTEADIANALARFRDGERK